MVRSDVPAPAGTGASVSEQPLGRRPVVLIPAYRPAPALPNIVAELAGSPEIQAVIVLNDGSGAEFDSTFEAAAGIGRVHVLSHVVNLGKGAALKAGFNYAACTFPGSVGVITADADGQHAVKDILRTAEALAAHPRDLVLGVRRFEGGIPLRSKLGNVVTKHVLRAITGQSISDTQTGLRGVPMKFIPTLMRLRPNGYDFELDMLLASKRTMRRITEVGIETIYSDGNPSSHFNPLLDSMRIYFLLIRFGAASLGTAALDNLVFIIGFHFWPHVLGCQIVSRGVAGLFNYYVNKRGVFHARVKNTQALPRYWASVLVFGTISYLLIHVLHSLSGVAVTSAKLCAETILFAFSFVVQRDIVFAARPAPKDPNDGQGD